MTWRGPYLDLRSGLFVPRLVTWDPETGEFMCVDGPKGFATWEEARRQGGFFEKGGLMAAPVETRLDDWPQLIELDGETQNRLASDPDFFFRGQARADWQQAGHAERRRKHHVAVIEDVSCLTTAKVLRVTNLPLLLLRADQVVE